MSASGPGNRGAHNSPGARVARATELFRAGSMSAAEVECRAVLRERPDDADALGLLGAIKMRAGRHSDAVELFSRASALAPDDARHLLNRGEVLRQLGELDRAADDFERALALDPAHAIAHHNLGLTRRAQGRLTDAAESYRRAVQLRPNYVKAHYHLGNVLRALGQDDDAERAYRESLRIEPAHVESWNNLGELFANQVRTEEAVACFERAIGLRSDHSGAHFNLAMVLLLRGDLVRGWREHEWRWKTAQQARYAREFAPPTWDGSDLNGKSILLHAEQGIGDALQFVRYASLVARRGAREVVVECHAPIATLVRTVPGVSRVVAQGEPLPAFDVHAPLLSLPLALGTATIDSIPADIPYLFPDVEKVADWKARLAPYRRARNVGFVWAGNPDQANDGNRSAPLARLAPLTEVADTRFFSLQKGLAAAQARAVPAFADMVDLSEQLADFSDTAAAMANMDAVVTVCTSVAHLAGAMGRPTITMLCHNADWRWLLHRDDSPWYPTMKLVRQKAQGDWADVAARVRQILERDHL